MGFTTSHWHMGVEWLNKTAHWDDLLSAARAVAHRGPLIQADQRRRRLNLKLDVHLCGYSETFISLITLRGVRVKKQRRHRGGDSDFERRVFRRSYLVDGVVHFVLQDGLCRRGDDTICFTSANTVRQISRWQQEEKPTH